MNQAKSFIFKGYNADIVNGKAEFNYKLIKENAVLKFIERIYFSPIKTQIPQDLLKNVLDNLMIILGISYWKLYAPSEIVIDNNFLTKEAAQFWNTVYTKGLGEFFYKNNIDFRGLVSFPYNEDLKTSSTEIKRQDRSLLGIGGGKDSIVAAEMLKVKNQEFDLITSSFPLQIEVAKIIGRKVINIRKEIDPKLLELNKQEDAYNGHIPISVYYAFQGLMAAIFYDYDSVVVGNEKSANYGNVEYLGQIINHQWSKSEEFEKLFNKYIKTFITPSISYYSPLRNMSELDVVREFVRYPKYFKVFSSCNRNFKISNLHLGGVVKRHLRGDRMDSSKVLGKWCGECPKCLFVFICLSVVLPKKEILDIFGKNLFDDESLIPLFEELIGVRNFKPFECVGTPQEVKKALQKISEKGEFNYTVLVKHFKTL